MAQRHKKTSSLFARLALACVRFYQGAISPHLPAACRYYPTCSEYTRQAVERFGARRGLWLGVKRICRCHPFRPGGIDPVPQDYPTQKNNQRGA